MFILDAKSLSKLQGVHPDLVAMVKKAASLCDQPFVVFEGVRTIEREKSLIARGLSKLKDPRKCRHVPTQTSRYGLVAHAVDLVPIVKGNPSWTWPEIYPIARAMKSAGSQLHFPIEWGGDWKWKDGAHYQLPWALYP